VQRLSPCSSLPTLSVCGAPRSSDAFAGPPVIIHVPSCLSPSSLHGHPAASCSCAGPAKHSHIKIEAAGQRSKPSTLGHPRIVLSHWSRQHGHAHERVMALQDEASCSRTVEQRQHGHAHERVMALQGEASCSHTGAGNTVTLMRG